MITYQYLAGFLDGEGCFTINFSKSKKRIQGQYSIFVQVALTDFNLLNEIKNQYGGSIYKMKRRSPKHNNCWLWKVCSREAVKLVKNVYPYLILKKSQAKLILSFDKTISSINTGKGLTKNVVTLRQKIKNKLSYLHKHKKKL